MGNNSWKQEDNFWKTKHLSVARTAPKVLSYDLKGEG